jgi:hypothetical protein
VGIAIPAMRSTGEELYRAFAARDFSTESARSRELPRFELELKFKAEASPAACSTLSVLHQAQRGLPSARPQQLSPCGGSLVARRQHRLVR